jgi:hypothetical protein
MSSDAEALLARLAELPPGDLQALVELSKAGDPQGKSFSLQADRTTKLNKAEEQRYSSLYKKGWRQIRRWIDKGEKAGDPCPLHDPKKLLSWWPRHNTWRVPPEIEEAALAATKASVPDPAQPPAAATAMIPPADSSPPDPALPASAPGKSIDIESFDPEEGDRLRELKQIQAAKFSQLKDALKAGEDCSILESKYIKLCETIDKIETRVAERLKKRGLFILRDAVERDLAAAAELLRQTRASMIRRVHELCPSLSAEQRAEVTAAIEQARSSEERLLCHLNSLSADDLLRELAAA